jgi:hypothetical protein
VERLHLRRQFFFGGLYDIPVSRQVLEEGNV